MDIKVDRITDMVLERLKKNNREKACETNEEKDTIHEENIVVKPRYKKGKKEMQADGVNRIGRKALMSANFNFSSPYSPSCELDKIKKDEHRCEEEKKRSGVKNEYDGPDLFFPSLQIY